MGTVLQCPACGAESFDLHCYDSLMMLSEHLALFTLKCPECRTVVSSVCVVPDDMMPAVRQAAEQMGAGMG